MYRPLIIGPYELCLDTYFLYIDIIGLYISRNLYASMHIYLCLHIHDDDCFYSRSWRNNVVTAFGTLSSFLTCFTVSLFACLYT